MNKHLHLQYYNSNTLLLINQKGQIKMLYTPFRVICISATEYMAVGVRVYIDEVLSNDRDELQYVIFNTLHSYRHFKLPIMFQRACSQLFINYFSLPSSRGFVFIFADLLCKDYGYQIAKRTLQTSDWHQRLKRKKVTGISFKVLYRSLTIQ